MVRGEVAGGRVRGEVIWGWQEGVRGGEMAVGSERGRGGRRAEEGEKWLDGTKGEAEGGSRGMFIETRNHVHQYKKEI